MIKDVLVLFGMTLPFSLPLTLRLFGREIRTPSMDDICPRDREAPLAECSKFPAYS